MKTEFVLRIDIANDATQGDYNLADMLTNVARTLKCLGIEDNRAYNVRDYNGNVVGRFGRYSTEDADDYDAFAEVQPFQK